MRNSPAWLVAAVVSVAAGLIHAAASGAHVDDRTLAALFALAAVLQVGWAAWALACPGALAFGAGLVVHVGSLAVWTISRTVGIGFIDGLARGQDVALQDGMVVGLELVAVAALGAAVVSRSRSVPAVSPTFLAGASILALVAALPAMAFPHEHADHEHDGEHGRTREDAVAVGGGALDDHVHAADDLGLPPLPDVPGATPDDRAAAIELIADMKDALGRFPDAAAAEAAGYRSIGDGFTGFEHLVHYGYVDDETVLDADKVESLVFEVGPDGRRELVSGMFILPRGNTMTDVPDVGGPFTVWHDHQNLCWNPDGSLAGVLVDGECRPGGTFRATPPMLHVWVVEHPCGPFAGIDGSHGTGCDHEH